MTIEFKMPKLGESVTEGTVGRWLKQAGDELEQYEPMLEVTTDKVDTEIPSPITGKLVQILVEEGDTVPVGTPIAVLAEEGAADTPAASVQPGNDPVQQREGEQRPEQPAQTPRSPSSDSLGFISPVVARLAQEHAVDLTHVNGSGREGRITKQDIKRFVAERELQQRQAASQPAAPAAMPTAQPAAQPAPMPVVKPTTQPALMPTGQQAAPSTALAYQSQQLQAGDELVPLSGMRRSIAEHMVRSKQTSPHVTTVMEVDLSAVTAHRQRSKSEFERQGVKLTFTPYFVQAVVAGLQTVPLLNATYTDQGVLMKGDINIGMAVAIADGLIVPVIHQADDKSLLGLARVVNDLAERARTRRLQADEVTGGTFTITNHGVSGSLFAMPIINQPQSAILGIGAIQKRAVVVTQQGLDAIAIRPMCYLSLTFDHRLVDGATADQFLGTVVQTLTNYSAT